MASLEVALLIEVAPLARRSRLMRVVLPVTVLVPWAAALEQLEMA